MPEGGDSDRLSTPQISRREAARDWRTSMPLSTEAAEINTMAVPTS